MDNIYVYDKVTRKGMLTIAEILRGIKNLRITEVRLWNDAWSPKDKVISLSDDTLKKALQGTFKPETMYIEGYFDSIETHICIRSLHNKTWKVSIAGTHKAIHTIFEKV